MPVVELRRHDMVRIDPAAWIAMFVERQLVTEPIVDDWANRGWPLVVRRPDCVATAGKVALGLPLPPSHGKRRIAVNLPALAITAVSPPPMLVDASTIAPDSWRPTIDRLLAVDAGVRAFGSLAWCYLTGLPYLSPTSDIDLLWTPGISLGEISAIDAAAPMRIDGEVVAADGGAVQWRELLSATGEVLVKRLDSASMTPVAVFLAGPAKASR